LRSKSLFGVHFHHKVDEGKGGSTGGKEEKITKDRHEMQQGVGKKKVTEEPGKASFGVETNYIGAEKEGREKKRV